MMTDAAFWEDPPAQQSSSEDRLDCDTRRVAATGLRLTRPRRAIAAILFGQSRHHFSADDVLAAAAGSGQRLSLATVYNTLNEFAAHGLIRRLATAGRLTHFDTDTGDHHHFHDEAAGRIYDIAPGEIDFARLPAPPAGYRIANIDVVIRLEADPDG